jgi:serine/threonine protein kinase
VSVELDETQPASRDSERWPAHIGKYEIERELGAGGNGIVLLARDPTLDRKVAIKILRRGDDDNARQRLVREAQAVAALAHDNVIVVHEVGTVDDRVFVAMEYMAGGTLAARAGASAPPRTCAPGAGSRPHTRPAWCIATSSPTTCSSATAAYA